MTANHSEGGAGPPGRENEKAAPAKSGSIVGTTATSRKLSNTAETVKTEARLHFRRWLATGQSYHLRLARVKFFAAWKGAA
jgi:hypothetical protein